MRFSSFIILLFSLIQLNAQVETRNYYSDEGLVPRERQVDFTHLKLEMTIDTEKKQVNGLVEHSFKVLRKEVDTLFLDGIKMDIHSVLLNDDSVEYEVTNKGVVIRFAKPLLWDEAHKLSIDYSATPSKGLYFIGWDKAYPNARNQIWTQGQGIDNRHWIPMYDEKNDKVISEIIVEFDANYQVLSNGKLLSKKKQKNGKTKWHYRISHPHAPYLIMLGIGRYEIYRTTSQSGVPLNLYYYPDQAHQREPTYRYSKRMFDFFEAEIGVPYPWETYSQIPVQDFMYGAMENTTATIFGDFYLVDSRTYLDKNYVRVDAHELAHQWFGDKITARASAHHWLQEGFATHYDMMYQKEAFGQDYFDWVRRNYTEQSINASKIDLKPLAHSSAGVVRHYPKGAFVLEMLKYVTGREQFNAAIKYYLEKHAYENVNTNDLLVAFHERLGLSLNWFWEQWIYKGGEPKYQVEFHSFADYHVFEISQIHDQNELVGLFNMPIVFQIYYTDGSSDEKRVVIDQKHQKVKFDNNGKSIAYVLFDPNSQIMSEVLFQKPTDMLVQQAEKAEHMLDRYDAIVGLKDQSFEGKYEWLLKRYETETFHAIRSEIAMQLMPLMNEFSDKVIEIGLKSMDHELKKTILDQTIRISESNMDLYQNLLLDSSYVVIEKALDLLSFYAPEKMEEYMSMTEGVRGDRSNNVQIARLKNAYLVFNDSKYLEELVELASPDNEFTTKQNVFKALKKVNAINQRGIEYLFDALMSFNARLRGPAKRTIDYFFEQEKFKREIVDYASSREWSDKEFKRVVSYMVY